MQIVSCTKRNTGDSVDRTKGEVQQFEDVQVEEWDIVVNEAGASSSWIIANAPLPNFISPHPDNQNLRCTGEYQIRRVDGSPIHFQATVTYKGLPPGPGLPPGEDGDSKPEKRDREPYLEEWSTVKSQEPIDVDISGDPICTIVGEQFDPPIVADVFDLQVTYGKNVQNRNQALQDAVGTVNSDPFEGYAAGRCLIDSVSYKYLTDPDSSDTYWRQTTTISIRRKKAPDVPDINVWDVRIRAEGYLAKNSENEVVHVRNSKALTDVAQPGPDDGGQSSVPRLHDLTTGRQIDNPKDAQWYIFETVESTNFAQLNIK